MKNFLVAAFSLVLMIPQLSRAATVAYAAANAEIIVNGVAYGSVFNWRGADLRATVASVDRAGASPEKHVTNVTIDPLVVEVSLPLKAPLADLVTAFCNSQPASAVLLPYRSSINGQNPATVLECYSSTLIEVKFQELDAASKTPTKVTLTFAPERVRMISFPVTAPASTVLHAKNTSNFSLTISGISSSPVARIGELTISRKLAPSGSGSSGIMAPLPATVSNLLVTLSLNAPEWTAWRDDFLVKGNSSDAHERTGVLTFSDAASLPLYSLQLSNVGIAHFVNVAPEIATTNIARLEAELYIESVAPVTAGATPGGSSAGSGSKPPSGAPLAAPVTETIPAATAEPTAPVKPTDSKTKAPTGKSATTTATGVRAGAEKKPVTESTDRAADIATKPAPEKLGTTTTATPVTPEKTSTAATERKTTATSTSFPAVRNAEDKGARDPEGLPRPEDSVRKSFAANKGKDSSQENATYTSTQSSDALSEFYNKALTGDGWEEYRRDENNFGLDKAHQIIVTYTKAKDRLVVTLTDTKRGEAGITIRLDRTF